MENNPARDSTRERWQAVLDTLIDPVVVLAAVRDSEGRVVDFTVLDANRAAADAVGRPVEAWIGSRLLALVPGLGGTDHVDALVRVVATGEPLLRTDWQGPSVGSGEPRWFDVRAIPLDGGLAVTWRDATDRHMELLALADSERNYRLVAESTAEVVARSTVDGRIRWVSPTITQLLGWAPDEMTGRTLGEFVHPEYSAVVAEAGSVLRAGAPATYRAKWRARGGEYRWLESTVTPVRDERGTVVERVASIRDVEQEMLSRQALEDLQSTREDVIESAVLGVARVGLDGSFQQANQALCRLVGRDTTWFAGRTTAEMLHPDDRESVGRDRSALAAGDADVLARDLRLLRADDSTVWVRRIAALVRNADGKPDHLMLLFEDLTAERRDRAKRLSALDRYELLAQNTSDVVWVHSPDGVLQWVSPSVTRLLGYRPESLVGTRTNLIVADDRPACLAALRTAVERHESRLSTRVRLLTAQGAPRWVDSDIDLVWSEDGTLTTILSSTRDVTAERGAEERLAFSDEHFRLMAENASDVVFVADSDGAIRWMSPSVTDLLGLRAEAVVGHRVMEFVRSVDRPKLIAASAAVTGGQRAQCEVKLEAGPVADRWVSVSLGPVLDPAGQVVGQVGALRDVDAEHRARADLQAAEARYRLLAEHATDVVYQTAADGTILWVSEGVERILGWTPQQLLGTNGFDITAPEDHATVAAAMSSVSPTRSASVRMRALTADGGTRWIDSTVHPVVGDDGDVVGFVGGWRDVQAEQDALEELRSTRSFFEQAVRLAPVAMGLLRPDGHIVLANDALCRLVGRTEQDLQSGTTWRDLTHPDDLATSNELVRQLLAGERDSFTQTKRYLHPDGRTVLAELWVYAVRDAGGSPLFQIVQILPVGDRETGPSA